MISRRTTVLAIALFSAFAGTNAWAFEKAPFTPVAFEAAQKAGKPILVEITAPWCPTCKAQKPILGELAGQSKYKNLTILEVDFDSQKDVVKKLGAQSQSTLIAFKGAKETARSVGDTKRDSIEKLLESSL